jgi:hypothetical protein
MLTARTANKRITGFTTGRLFKKFETWKQHPMNENWPRLKWLTLITAKTLA